MIDQSLLSLRAALAAFLAAMLIGLCGMSTKGQVYHDECRRFYWAPRLMNKYLHENGLFNTRDEQIPRKRYFLEQNLPTPYRLVHSDEQDEYNHRHHYRLSVYLDDNNHVTKLKCC
ncbi:hypothetical protein GGI11_000896 [Coemansia sp. RSA 2049]|nr:hypothetical protein H4217_007863 [Coemansia sp. RSA 1939]KAJ2524324.1 hypothetical protein GGI11_000896 [Coemansia sp. RSA 2049]KAJ2588472.1 hypothetical protein EV177_009413 [Coemansia sp. RSA 1804]KAJ2648123.1 hypothetical protein GGH99_007900 [Coemansia sp. RSA 1285]